MDRFVSCCFPAETWHRAAPKEKSEGSAAEGAEEGGDMKNPRELCVFFRLDKKKLSTAGVAMNGPGDKNKWVRGVKRGKHKSGSVKVLIQFRPKTAADGFFYLVGHGAVGRVKY